MKTYFINTCFSFSHKLVTVLENMLACKSIALEVKKKLYLHNNLTSK